VPVTSSAGSRPQVTAVTAPVTAFTAPVTATTVTESGQRVRNPRRRRPPEQRLSPGRAGGTKAEHHHLVDSALPDVARFAMLRRIYMLYRMCISCPNLPSRDTFWNSGPAGQCFRVPPRAFPRIRVRGITGVTLKSCCLRCSASTCCPHLVSTVTGEDRRLGCGPVTHLVRGGPSSGLAGLGRTGLSGSSLPVPIGPGPAILHARSPSEDWAGPAPTGAARRHGLLPPTALPCACPSVPGVSPRFEMRARATD
jgi:hypothetical protein